MLHLALSMATVNAPAVAPKPRWEMTRDGGIRWNVRRGDKPHDDHIEMSGRRISFILGYATKEGGALVLHRILVWPALRTIPNNTHGSLARDFGFEFFPKITVDGKPVGEEYPSHFELRGMLTVRSRTRSGIEVTRTLFPSTTKPAAIENVVLTNTSQKPLDVMISPFDNAHHTDAATGVEGEYILTAHVLGDKTVKLQPGARAEFSIIFSGRKAGDPPVTLDPKAEQAARKDYVESLWSKLVFECPDPVLEREFAFCKIRAAESIFETKGGLMHGPGGGAYYAAIWANDQAEYANPFFAFLGDAAGNESALNAFRLFARHTDPRPARRPATTGDDEHTDPRPAQRPATTGDDEHTDPRPAQRPATTGIAGADYKPIPSSIIAEGIDHWQGAGDRGDAAMVAYGASRFALARGDRKIAEEVWPLVEWCLEYCRRKTNADGVVASDSDELEGRFPAGDANLCTSALTYDALRSAASLGESLGKPEATVDEYRKRALALQTAIEKHFGATVEGYQTYRYYDGNATLRAWVCIPLTMGIFDRKNGTIEALFSPRLWTDDGLATEAGKETFWDRSTLYALRGVFAAGETERALTYLKLYSHRRLLEEHVPYPVEAWPEGGQRHLSAESALYCRVITEGIFGIRPTGLRSFELTPRLPKGWDKMALRKVQAFGSVFDVVVSRKGNKVAVEVSSAGKQVLHEAIGPGVTVSVMLPGSQ